VLIKKGEREWPEVFASKFTKTEQTDQKGSAI
jgi:hypothetical protein